ncbi:MAG: PSP1 domain-containing protein [Anaerolineae bacterium]
MPEVVGVRFKPCTKMYYFSPGAITDLKVGDPVIVETIQGEELGWVIIAPTLVSDDEIKGKLKTIVRRATPVDLAIAEEFRSKEAAALAKCREKITELGLPMKAISAEYSFNGERLVISFVAEERIDFRELVRQLAKSFKTHVEMRQIGARDEAKLLGGYAVCGRKLCCASWLTEFHPVSIKMAKQQDLPLTPTEISGVCGRLLCCLVFENDLYVEVKQSMPKVGSVVNTPHGKGTIVSLNVLTETLTVELQNELTIEVKASEVTPLAEQKRPAQPEGKSSR